VSGVVGSALVGGNRRWTAYDGSETLSCLKRMTEDYKNRVGMPPTLIEVHHRCLRAGDPL
jgi:hypothetical protein